MAKRFNWLLLLLHVFLVILVLLAPPVLFDAIAKSQQSGSRALRFVGGLGYPIYIGYWVSRLPNARVRFVLLHLIALLTVSLFALIAHENGSPLLLLAVPAIAGAIGLPIAVVAALLKKRQVAVIYLYSTLFCLPIGLVFTFFNFLSLGGVAMRY